MLRMVIKAQAYLKDDKGATAVEYALIVGGIAVAIGGAIVVFGGNLGSFFTGLTADLGL